MKNLYIFICSFLLLLSCSNDDDNTRTEVDRLVGRWQVVAWYNDVVLENGEFQSGSIENGGITEFKENQRFENLLGCETGTYEITDVTNNILVYFCEDGATQSSTLYYTFENDGRLNISYGLGGFYFIRVD